MMFDSFKVSANLPDPTRLIYSIQDHGFISVSEKADRETLNTIEKSYYLEDDFDPKQYELEVNSLLSLRSLSSFFYLRNYIPRPMEIHFSI